MKDKLKIIYIIVFIVIIVYIIYKYKNNQIENYPNSSSSTALSVLCTDSNGNMISNVLLPPGTIAFWEGTTPPSGWAICDGLNNTPDLRGRFVLGAGQGEGLTNRPFDTKGGTENETLTIEQIPSHNHILHIGSRTVTTSINGEHKHNYTNINTGSYECDPDYNEERCSNSTSNKSTTTSGDHNHSFTIDYGTITSTNNGSGSSHNNMPPFFTLNYIMKL